MLNYLYARKDFTKSNKIVHPIFTQVKLEAFLTIFLVLHIKKQASVVLGILDFNNVLTSGGLEKQLQQSNKVSEKKVYQNECDCGQD